MLKGPLLGRGGSTSSRAAIAACTVSGSRSAAAAASVGDRPARPPRRRTGCRRGLGDPRRELPGLGRQQRHRQLAGGLTGQGPQLDLGDVPRRAAEVRVGARGAPAGSCRRPSAGASSRPEDHLLDQIEEAIVGPVRVVDPDHQRPLAGEQGDQAPPGPLQLVLDVPRRPPRRRAPSRGVAARASASGGAELARRCASASWTCATESSAPRRQRPAGSRRAPRMRSRGRTADFARPGSWAAARPRASAPMSSRREASLADPGIPGDHHQLGRSVAGGAPVGELEQVRDRHRDRSTACARPDPLSRRCIGGASTARQAASGAGKPFASIGSRSSTRAARQARAARSPTRTSPGAPPAGGGRRRSRPRR